MSAASWTILTPAEVYAPLPPIKWRVKGLIARGTLGMISAYGAGSKTWLEIDLLTAVALGRRWLGLFACKRGDVFLVDFESGAYELRRRFQALAREAPGESVEPVDGVSFVTMPGTMLNEPDFIKRLEPIAAKVALIAIDTLSAGSGGVDENDARFALPLNRLKALAERTGCAIVVLHHVRKGRDQKGGDDLRETTRGTSAIFNALDWELKVFRSKEDDALFTCRQTKARSSRGVKPFSVHIEDIGDAAPAGKEVVRLRGRWLEDGAIDADAAARQALAEQAIVKLADRIELLLKKQPGLGGERGVRDALREAKVAFSNKDIGPALLRLKQQGRIENRGAAARPKLHAVKPRLDAGPAFKPVHIGNLRKTGGT